MSHFFFLTRLGRGRYGSNRFGTTVSIDTSVPDGVPDAPSLADWAISDDGTGGDATVTINALPNNNGSSITDLSVKIDGGTAISLGGTALTDYPLTGRFTDGVQSSVTLYATNGVGDGPESSAKSVTTTDDSAPPTFSSGSPADEATDVAANTTITLTFSEDVSLGAGNEEFHLWNVTDGATEESFDVTAGTGDNGGTVVLQTATQVRLTPGADLQYGEDYAIRWDSGAVVDGVGNPLAANTGDTTYNFSVASRPSLSSSTPADDATGVEIDSTITLTFDRNVFAGESGTLFRLRDVTSNNFEEDWSPSTGSGTDGGSISISGDTVTLTRGNDMDNAHDYAVWWAEGAVVDIDGNKIAQQFNNTSLNFTTTGAGGGGPTFVSASFGPQPSEDGNVPLSITTLSVDSTIRWILTTASQSSLTQSQVSAGNDENDATADDSGSGSLTSASPSDSMALSATLDDDYYINFTLDDGAGGVSGPFEYGPTTIDNVVSAPSTPLVRLDSATTTADGQSLESGAFALTSGKSVLVTVAYYNASTVGLTTWAHVTYGTSGRTAGTGTSLGTIVESHNSGRVCCETYLISGSATNQSIQVETSSDTLRAIAICVDEIDNGDNTVDTNATDNSATSGTGQAINITGATNPSTAVYFTCIAGGLGAISYTGADGELAAVETGSSTSSDVQVAIAYEALSATTGDATTSWTTSGNNCSYWITLV